MWQRGRRGERWATRPGPRALLVEAGDFAGGTSSRSSKLIHGGLRYLRNLQIGTTIDSVRERELLLREGRGLVNPLPFRMPRFGGGTPRGPGAEGARRRRRGRDRLRLLRGTHLVLPFRRLALPRAVAILHPADGRPVFVFPWEGVTIIGTTDVGLTGSAPTEPVICPDETGYLLGALPFAFPSADLSPPRVQATFAGVRSVLDTGKANPSKESREALLWMENGLMTVTGGKLTTFRRVAIRALRFGRRRLPGRDYRLRGRGLAPAPPGARP